MIAPWDLYWLSPTIGIIASLVLLWIGAYVLIRRESTTSLFVKDEIGLLIAKVVVGAILLLAGLCAFWRSLGALLSY
jgi:hypothetical protein